MTTRRKTKYQREHFPVSRTQILCHSKKPLVDNPPPGPYEKEGICPDCGAWLKRGGRPHKPNRIGAFGWLNRYRDGSWWIDPGPSNIPRCPVCERTDVPALHTTPLGYECYPFAC